MMYSNTINAFPATESQHAQSARARSRTESSRAAVVVDETSGKIVSMRTRASTWMDTYMLAEVSMI